jgi:hypothetical protein
MLGRMLFVSTLSLAMTAPLAIASEREAAHGWQPLEQVAGPTMSAVLDDGTTVLLTAAGPKDSEIYQQRRSPDGTYGDPTLVAGTTAKNCVIDHVDAARSTVGASFRCQPLGQLEDPPSIAVEIVLGPGGVFARRFDDSRTSSVDVSPNGRFVVFATDNELFGTREHVLSYSFIDGPTDRSWRERGDFGDRIVAAVDNSGDVEMLRTTGFEDEPSFWVGGAIELRHYDPTADKWALDFANRKPGVGVTDSDVDLAGDGRVFATFVRHYRSAEELWTLRGEQPDDSQLRQLSNRTPNIYANSSALTAKGTALTAWQLHTPKDHVATLFASWAPGMSSPRKSSVDDGSVETPSINASRGLNLSATPDGHYTLSWVRRSPGATRAVVTAINAAAPRGPGTIDKWGQRADITVQGAGGVGGRTAIVLGHWLRGRLGTGASLAYNVGSSIP